MKKEVKVTIDGLGVGMFVSRLDRPWIKTPFMLEGIAIQSQDDIDELRKYCRFVYVDVEQGPTPAVEHWVLKEKHKYHQSTSKVEKELNKASKSIVTPRKKSAFDVLRRHTYHNTRDVMDELSSAESASKQLGKGFNTLVSDLSKGRNIDLDVVKSGVADMVDSIMRNPTASVWVSQMRKHDDYAYSRALGSSVWCATFGRHLGLDLENINDLALGGLLLDIGKTKIPPQIINKIGELGPKEAKIIHAHVNIGVKILVQSKGTVSVNVLQMVATHHERHNGKGYPQGLKGEKMPLYGKIAGIVDTYDAMTSDKPYTTTAGLSPHQAISELYKLRDNEFQAELVEQFIQAVGVFPTGSLVELTTGEIGAVTAVNSLRRLRPAVMIILDENKKPLKDFKHIDLSEVSNDIAIKQGVKPETYGIDLNELFL
jgi:HD-GYP domain-containing protein (c-di-GMP phosphodiesterase class II)